MLPVDEPVLMVDNKSYRYGDGLFETMKIVNSQIRLSDYHFERFFSALSVLHFSIPALLTAERIKEEITRLCIKNGCENLARVRLSAFRGNGGIFDGNDELQYTIECWPLPSSLNHLNENGLVIGIHPDVRKSCDKFSNIKSANYLPYTMAAKFAKENKWNDCLVLNSHERIADASIANVFIIKDDTVRTPSLQEGCVSGVMRKYLLNKLREKGYQIAEGIITVEDLEAADEVFLTNAISGIKWVKQLGNKEYKNITVSKIYTDCIKTI